MKYSPGQGAKFYTKTKEFLQDGVIKEHIGELRELIRFHEWKYYIQNDPFLSDSEYDQLFSILKTLEEENPDLITLDSPTQRVSADLTEEFESVPHLTPMLSLDNSYDEESLFHFDKQVRKLCNIGENEEIVYNVEPKFDGGSIALVYENDKLIRAATRGDGIVGEEMTSNARILPSIPLQAAFSKHGMVKVELRGEAVISKENFMKLNEERLEEGKTPLANPRNSAAGGLRTKDPSETRNRLIEVFMFSLSYAEGDGKNDVIREFSSHSRLLDLLVDLGFKVPVKERTTCQGIRNTLDFIRSWEAKREGYPYEIDGMVVKVDSIELQEKCGSTSHHPRWAVAFKFKAKQASTRLIDIVYQVGKVGSITPVAKLEPVQLAGVTVSSVSLHNEEFIRSKDLRIRDIVLVERAGDVIPYIVKSFDELRDGSEDKIDFPEYCPVNDTDQPIKLVKQKDEAAWRCPKCVCGAQDLQKMIFHVSKDAMDIDGFGKSYIEKFYDLGWIRNIADIYNLDYKKIGELDGFGEKSAENLKRAVDRAKANPVYRLLHSLSIHHLGKKASKLIAGRIDHVLDLKNWTVEKLTDIKDIGPVVAENLVNYFSDETNTEMLKKMEEYGVNLTQTKEDKPLEVAKDAPLRGKSILFTGTLQTMTRKEAQDLAEKAGAKNISAVSKNLDILVVGENAGSKLKNARDLGTIQIMSEEEFLSVFSHVH